MNHEACKGQLKEDVQIMYSIYGFHILWGQFNFALNNKSVIPTKFLFTTYIPTINNLIIYAESYATFYHLFNMIFIIMFLS